MTVPAATVLVTPGHEDAPNHDPKSVVLPSPVIAVDGNVTVVPLHPPLTLHVTDIVYVTVVPLGTDEDNGLMLTDAVPAADADPPRPTSTASGTSTAHTTTPARNQDPRTALTTMFTPAQRTRGRTRRKEDTAQHPRAPPSTANYTR